MKPGIFRDPWGIPHLRADSLTELARLQGREVARSRWRQIELERRRSEGRLSEVVGPAGLDWDTFSRRLGVDQTAQTAYDGLDAETRGFVAAFADGVEEGLRSNPAVPQWNSHKHSPDDSLEDSLTEGVGEEVERRWKPWTPIGVFLVQQALFANLPGALWERRLHAAYGEEGLTAFGLAAPAALGSNAFGVAGERTASGLPLVAGDPHRVFEVPNVYAQVRLCCTDPDDPFDVAGFTFPGVPGVQHFAHARSVAWAITNAMADYQVVTHEHLERHGSGVRALGPDGWEDCSVRTETVAVRGAADVEIEIVVTRSGPVVVGGVGEDEAFSLRTTSGLLGDGGFGALLPLLRARTADDVDAAMDHWVEPVNNVVIADASGALRHRVAGRVPLGKAPARPVDATAGTATPTPEWVDPLPRIPVDDAVVVTANDCATDDFTKVGWGFASPYRASRIRALLTDRDDWTADTLRVVSLDARVGDVEAIWAAVERADGLAADAVALRAALRGWDREMRVDSVAAAAFVGVRDAIVAGIVARLPDLAGPSPHGRLFDASSALGPRVLSSLDVLLGGGGEALGVDVGAVVRAALEETAAAPSVPWGARHAFHPLTAAERLGLDDEIAESTGLGRAPSVDGSPLAGDDDCVAATHAVPGSSVTSRGPVARYVWDLGARDRSYWAVPLGASQDGPHAEDQFTAWDTGHLVPLVTDWDALTPD